MGEPTYGVSTGLPGFFMPDSLYSAVTNSRKTDGWKKGNGEAIIPDKLIKRPSDLFTEAYEWIQENANP